MRPDLAPPFHLQGPPAACMSLQLVANVVVLAAIYALVSTGYVLIYRVSRVLNLAHGELMMVGAYLLVATAGLFSGDPLLALVLAAICGLVMGIVVYVGADALDDRRSRAGGGADHHRARHSVARPDHPDLDNPAILSRRHVRLAQSAGADRARRADFGRKPRHRVSHRRRLCRPVRVFAVHALGRADAGGRAESAAGRAARHPPARRLCVRLGPVDLHCVARRHAAGPRFRCRVRRWRRSG